MKLELNKYISFWFELKATIHVTQFLESMPIKNQTKGNHKKYVPVCTIKVITVKKSLQ